MNLSELQGRSMLQRARVQAEARGLRHLPIRRLILLMLVVLVVLVLLV